MGSVLPPTMQWQGYVAGLSSPSTIKITHFFDCDKSKGINAIFIDIPAQWCSPCQQQASEMPMLAVTWASLGVKALTLMDEDNNSGAATIATALQQRDQPDGLTTIDVAADPDQPIDDWMAIDSLLPTDLLVDPRTMKVVSTTLSDANASGSQ